MAQAFKSAIWRSGLLTVTYNTGFEETFEVTPSEARQGVNDLIHEFEMQRQEMIAERMAEEAATRYWEEGPESFRAMREAEQRYEDEMTGARF